jgi:uncharacterized protein YdeI (YjbR/CyaY-like superfamily)
MEIHKGINCFYAKDLKAWRSWLKKNHSKSASIWLIIYHKQSGIPSVYYPDAVDESICFGWIDSKINKRDEQSYYQLFTQRSPKSNWSKVNKEKVTRLIQENRIQAAGLAMIDLAKKTGTWTALDKISELIMPEELEKAFSTNKIALANFNAFPPSTKRGIYEWIINAKQSTTRAKRIEETVLLAGKNIRANQYIPKQG